MFTRRAILGSTVALAGLSIGGGLPAAMRASPGRRTPPLIADLQQRTFRFFWETTNPQNGLAPDRWPSPSFASIAAVGFALTAYPIGVVNGWITRAEARKRTLTTLDFFAGLPQGSDPRGMSGYHGFFYHFLDMKDGTRFDHCELSTIDTTLLLAGMLFAQSWFDGDDSDERRIRMLADQIYARVDWRWAQPRAPFVAMGWHPESGFIDSDWKIYDEAMLLYLLAIAAPEHAIDPAAWNSWTAGFADQWSSEYGQPHIAYPPMFVHQYSQLWVDFRGIRDRFMRARGIDYAENSRRAALAQKAYAAANPGGWAGYGGDIWGLTACDGPGDFTATIGGRERRFRSYSERGPGEDDGTIAPTAAAGSIAFAPDIALPAIAALHRRYGKGIYQRYGFLDAFNPTLIAPASITKGRIVPGIGWIDGDYLGIDQGPIVGGIENWRSGLIWATMRRNRYVRTGLERAGFTGGWLARR